MIPFFDMRAQFEEIGKELIEQVTEVLSSTQYILGPKVAAFESNFARFSGVDHCIAVNSGTSALHLALLAHNIGPGDEVITVSQTFIATVAAIDYCGAIPVFVDTEVDRQTMCPDQLCAAIRPRTKAIVPVHLFGQPADMDPINKIAQKHGIPVIADAAQAHGAMYKGEPIAKYSSSAVFSFYPGKNLGACGEGGAVVTNDALIADRIRTLRDWGQKEKSRHEEIGYNARMDAVQGAVLDVKLKYLGEWNQLRASLAKLYINAFQEIDLPVDLRLPQVFADSDSAWHLFAIRTPARDHLRRVLQEAGIQTGIHYPVPVHLTPAFKKLGVPLGALPVSESNAAQVLSLPLYPELSEQNVLRVVDGVSRALKKL